MKTMNSRAFECDECEEEATYHLCEAHNEEYDAKVGEMSLRLRDNLKRLRSVNQQVHIAIKYLRIIDDPLSRAALEEIGEINESTP